MSAELNQSLFQRIEELYARIDARAEALTALHRSRLVCGNGCSSCCDDEITVYAVEAAHIVARFGDVLKNQKPGDLGMCALLDQHGSCRIYAARPYVCRTQGLPLHWIDEDELGRVVAYRDICPKNDNGSPLEALPQDFCWEIGPVEEVLAELQYEFGEGKPERVALRDLFVR